MITDNPDTAMNVGNAIAERFGKIKHILLFVNNLNEITKMSEEDMNSFGWFKGEPTKNIDVIVKSEDEADDDNPTPIDLNDGDELPV